MSKQIKLNIGSNNKRIDGFINVDALELPDVDVVLDITKVPYGNWHNNQVDEIVCCEVLEHISYHDVFKVLKEWRRILKPYGKLYIQVPDIGKMCEYYARGLVCDCVPNKAEKEEDFKAMEGCFKCSGKAVINPLRWHVAFTGAQKHEFDTHKNHFNRGYLDKLLTSAGFKEIIFKDHIYKLIVNCIKL